jgi:hypothetical protein
MPAIAKDRKAPPAPPPPASVDGLPIGAIPKQELPAKGCAAFLWTRGPSHALVAMAVAETPALRIAIDGKIQDYALSAQHGTGGYGFSESSEYRGGDVTATLDLQIDASAVQGGARLGDSTLRIDRPGRDSVVVPVGGMIGCA